VNAAVGCDGALVSDRLQKKLLLQKMLLMSCVVQVELLLLVQVIVRPLMERVGAVEVWIHVRT
jgi:hypothetical protein